jgi:hypothetical protein
MAEIITTHEQAEQQLTTVVTGLEAAANNMVIDRDDRYNQTAAFLQRIMGQKQTVIEFFKPMKDAAHKAHKQICDREKVMTDPLGKAEKLVKQKMGAYQQEVERKQREREAELRRLAEAERERKFQEAVAAEAQGDAITAEMAMMEAEVMDDAAAVAVAPVAAPKVKGISTRMSWEITGIDPAKVPVEFAGVCIRPVDEKEVLNLIKATKGKIQIPGITYKEKPIISARGA